MRIIQKRRVYLSLSAAFVMAALAAILLYRFHFGIDFTGGSLLEVSYSGVRPTPEAMRRVVEEAG
ncbi:protein translocase subunit SecF, partial [Candidatus Parcubacteria bacterium]|nr:protein translocase subunit SecF [Candidatus Parcubacteria bacterium]